MAETMSGVKQLISVQPQELKFQFELEKQSFCDLKVSNTTENHIAFKVKTTSPKKYFVRPNTGIIHPWDSCLIRVTLQAQQAYPPDMQCRDKFLIQSTVVPPNSETDSLPSDAFTKDSGRSIEEYKLRVIYISSSSITGNRDEDFTGNATGSPENNQMVRRLKEERDVAVRQAQQLQNELEMLKRRKGPAGFSNKFAVLVALVGMMLGFLLRLLLSSPST